ncbi:MAG TPA: family 10 glycosylhydrolase [Thermotogota bacterium]|nr:family 10 glycosylhydrolase [Thermotogota bacterium]HPJ87903.1 family 10 glycosylhydrolase [Thermotogota bacterium]HPR94996.1 family 10 glycosylhydrolase [Thermotogota bacterium]
MKKLFFLLLIIVICATTFFAAGNIGLSVVVDRIDLISEESVDNLLGECIKYRIDTLYVPVVSFMESLYDSEILPKSNVLLNNDTPESFDPLGYIMKKASNFDIQIIPLIDVFTVWPSEDIPVNQLHVAKKHPDWFSRNSLGELLTDPVILDPGVPAVQNFSISIVKEILKKYKPGQIAFYNFEYPTQAYGYNPYALKEYEQYRRNNSNRIINFQTFRKESLDDLIKRMKALSTSLGLSTRIFMFNESDYQQSLDDHFQDWVLWINKGYVDWSVFWYWFPDKKNVAHDTQWALEHVLHEKVIPALSPQSLQFSQYLTVLDTILNFDVSGVVVDSTDKSVMGILNENGVGVPR